MALVVRFAAQQQHLGRTDVFAELLADGRATHRRCCEGTKSEAERNAASTVNAIPECLRQGAYAWSE